MVIANVSVDSPNYEVVAVEPNGCEAVEIITLEVLVTTAVFTSQVGEICVGEKATFFDLSENATEYLWQFTNIVFQTHLFQEHHNTSSYCTIIITTVGNRSTGCQVYTGVRSFQR